jgi:hypothetical protein
MELARYLLEQPNLDPSWKVQVKQLLDFVITKMVLNTVPDQPGVFHSAYAVSEQRADTDRMPCHTARLASILAGYGAAINDTVRCAFLDRDSHSRMPLVPTPARLKRAGVRLM